MKYPYLNYMWHKQVQALGGISSTGDMGVLVRAAMRTPWPEALVSLLNIPVSWVLCLAGNYPFLRRDDIFSFCDQATA